MTERFKFSGFVLMSFFISMFIYPMVARWIWGGGWLANLGRSADLGNGAVDFAGSGVVHMIGGAMALAGAMALGPRIGRFNKNGSANAIPGHNIPMGVLGTLILFFGWFGFNPGSALGFTTGLHNSRHHGDQYVARRSGRRRVIHVLHVVVGPSKKPIRDVGQRRARGLVAITAPCAFVDTWAAVVIGLVVGVIVPLASSALEKLHVDDPVGATPVHSSAACGCCPSAFSPTATLTRRVGTASPARQGLFYGGHVQILAHCRDARSPSA